MASTKSQIDRFIDRYSPQVAAQFRAARKFVRKYFPRGYELVYDNYNALGCGFSTGPKASGVVISVVAYPRWVTLFFFNGATLEDREGMLQGSGRKIRSLRLQPFALLRSEAVSALMEDATKPFRQSLATQPRLTTLIRSVAVVQRSRRPPAAKEQA